MKSLWIVLTVIFAGFLIVPRTAYAQTDITVTVTGHTEAVAGSSSEHFVTFSQPVQVPGVGLAPGSYVFRFVAPQIVQVLNGDRSEVYAMFFTTPIGRVETTNEYAMTFQRVRDDAPPRMTAWYMPNETSGYAPYFEEIES